MKIAVPTRDGVVDNHFGHCDHYTIFTVEEGVIKTRETIYRTIIVGIAYKRSKQIARTDVARKI